MGTRSFSLVVLVVICVATVASAGQDDYTVPAREKLFAGTLSGMAEAYEILDGGLNSPNLKGDTRELVFLHALTRAGLAIFDRNDTAVTTSLVEIAEPFGVIVTGDKLFREDSDDPDRVRVIWPIDPNDPNDYYEVPPGADPEAAAAAINDVILPEIDAIVAELDTILDTPTPFLMTLTPEETNLDSPVDVDRGDVLALAAILQMFKVYLHDVANPGYDLTLDLADPLFDGLGNRDLPESTTVNAVLDAYPTLLTILPTVGEGRLEQAKVNFIASLEAVLAALDYIVAETDDQANDLLQIDAASPTYVMIRENVQKLRDSLVNDSSATYTVRSDETFTLSQAGRTVGRLNLRYDVPGLVGAGTLVFSEAGVAPAVTWYVDSFHIDGRLVEGYGMATMPGSEDYYYYDMWFEGTISSDGSQIAELVLTYTDYSCWPDVNGRVIGLAARRTDVDQATAELNLNPFYAGTLSPRDTLPQFDANSIPIPGTFGHALGNDPTLAGVTPGMTQDDWIGTDYTVFGLPSLDSLETDDPWYWHYLDRHPERLTSLGRSAGWTVTFQGDYPAYLIATKSRMLIDSIYGSGEDYLDVNEVFGANIPAFADIYRASMVWAEAAAGPPDGQYVPVGEVGLFGQYTGFILVENPGMWTSLTVVTDKSPSDTRAGAVGVYRLWSETYKRHFYTIDESEKAQFLQNSAGDWQDEGVVYRALDDPEQPNVTPVYRFYRADRKSYFYTINPRERDKLINQYADVWTYQEIAFYVFAEGRQPADALPVYRFWSPSLGYHFYTISQSERDKLINNYPNIWTYEGPAWYAYN